MEGPPQESSEQNAKVAGMMVSTMGGMGGGLPVTKLDEMPLALRTGLMAALKGKV